VSARVAIVLAEGQTKYLSEYQSQAPYLSHITECKVKVFYILNYIFSKYSNTELWKHFLSVFKFIIIVGLFY